MTTPSPPRPLPASSGEAAGAKEILPNHPVPAWLLSLGVHLVLLITLALVLRPVQRGAADEPGRTGGIVLVKQGDGQTEYLTESDLLSDDAAVDEASQLQGDQGLPSSDNAPVDIAAFMAPGDFGAGPLSDLESALPGTDGMLEAGGPPQVSGAQVTTKVFGVEGTGSRFLYVFDRSASMEGFEGRPISAAQHELIASLESLQPQHQFQIVFYNERPTIFNPFPSAPPQMLFATAENKELAARFVRQIRGEGGTRHMAALREAVNMGPDVIFFLTDADVPRLTDDELIQIERWNRARASINTIEFGSGSQRSADNFLVKIARRNDGQHVYIDVTKLRPAF